MTGRLLSRSGSNESKTYTLSKMKKKIALVAVLLHGFSSDFVSSARRII